MGRSGLWKNWVCSSIWQNGGLQNRWFQVRFLADPLVKIIVIDKQINIDELRQMAKEGFGDFVKGVCDLEKEMLALGGELHSDCYETLIENGSQAGNIWGFNIFPDISKERCLEFTSLINIRPNLGNRSMEIQSEDIRQKIAQIIEKIVIWN